MYRIVYINLGLCNIYVSLGLVCVTLMYRLSVHSYNYQQFVTLPLDDT